MRTFSFFVATLALLLTPSCTTGFEGDSHAKDPEERSNVMHLYRIDIDREAVKKGARLLFAEPPPHAEQGLRRGAQGYFSVSDSGFCRVDVRCAEPVIGLNGKKSAQIYTLVKFFGRITDDGERATTTSGEKANMRSMRAHDEVRFIERGRNKITIQPYLNGQPSAYLFHFNHASIGGKDIRIPWQ